MCGNDGCEGTPPPLPLALSNPALGYICALLGFVSRTGRHCCRDPRGDGIHPEGGNRGTTPLAPRRPWAMAARSPAVTGRTRPVLLGRRRSTRSSGGSPVMAGSTPRWPQHNPPSLILAAVPSPCHTSVLPPWSRRVPTVLPPCSLPHHAPPTFGATPAARTTGLCRHSPVVRSAYRGCCGSEASRAATAVRQPRPAS